jgi:hypothetical protein
MLAHGPEVANGASCQTPHVVKARALGGDRLLEQVVRRELLVRAEVEEATRTSDMGATYPTS